MPRHRLKRARWLVAGALLSLLLSACTPPDSFRSITPQGLTIQHLFEFEMVLSALVFLLVVSVLVVVLLRFRGRPGDADPPQTHGNRTLEIVWTATPFAIVTLLFVLSVLVMNVVRNSDPPPNAVTIQVIGHQWYWEYKYPDLHIVTAGELYIPTNTPVHLEVQSADVIHGFWVPQFGWKIDAIPGRTNVMDLTVDQAGTFQGSCTQFCGNEHAWMRTLVIAEPLSQFQAWARQQQAPPLAPTTAEATRGEQIFMSSTCASCHTIAGTSAKGTVGPDLTHIGSRQILGGGVLTNTPANMERWISSAQQVKPGILMPDFNLPPADIKALAAYLEGLK